MPKFTYISRDSSGQRVTAVGEADTRQSLLSLLNDRGLTVVQIQELKEQAAPLKGFRKNLLQVLILKRRIKTSDLAIFWRQFSAMIGGGLAIIEAIESIAEELEHKDFKRVLDSVVHDMWEGISLSQSMRKHDRVFSRMVVALIGAAEESGSLPEVTKQIATFLENRDRLIRKVRAALTYPIFLAGFFICVLGLANFWIIPTFRGIYQGFGAKLPWVTEFVFNLNAIFLKYFPWIVGSSIVVIALFIRWARKPSGRAVLDRVALRLPVFGKLFQQAAVARFCRSLAVLLFGGVPINRALEMAEEAAGNTVIANAIRAAREEILKGGKIAASLRTQKIFPIMAIRMIAAGEETGNMTSLLEKAAEFYEAQVDATLTTINTLIEPVMIVLIGVFVLIFVLALYMPIFSIGQSFRG